MKLISRYSDFFQCNHIEKKETIERHFESPCIRNTFFFDRDARPTILDNVIGDIFKVHDLRADQEMDAFHYVDFKISDLRKLLNHART